MPSFVLLRKLGLYLALFITLTVPASAQGKTVQTMNGLAFPDVPPNSPYSFLVIGHAYGRSVSTHNLLITSRLRPCWAMWKSYVG